MITQTTSNAQSTWYITYMRARDAIAYDRKSIVSVARAHVQHDAHMHAYDCHQHDLMIAQRNAHDRDTLVRRRYDRATNMMK